jgi:hypothetical protein
MRRPEKPIRLIAVSNPKMAKQRLAAGIVEFFQSPETAVRCFNGDVRM